jgi:hypothetical protein
VARGESGRIVIEVEPEVKQRLYAALALSGSTLKDWFIKSAANFCEESAQPSLFPRADSGREFTVTNPSGEKATQLISSEDTSKES